MTRKVVWSPTAKVDLIAIARHIALDDPRAARAIVARLRATGEALGRARTGQPGRVAGTFEKSVRGLPYVIAYELTPGSGAEGVSVLHVIHTARHWPSGDWPA